MWELWDVGSQWMLFHNRIPVWNCAKFKFVPVLDLPEKRLLISDFISDFIFPLFPASFFDHQLNQLYDAALLTRCYTQHALRPFIDSEINHKRHFIKIPFINKGIEFIDLPSIFKDRSVTWSIPAYFQNSEPPIICYKCNKPIRNTVFNFNKLVSDLDIHANVPESWDCKDSKFIYPAAGHIMTGNLKIISDSRIRYIVCKGPKYRFPSRIDFKKCREEIISALNDFGDRWCKRE